MLQFCEDTSPADWVERSDAPWAMLALFGPPAFDAYARVRFLPDPEHGEQRLSQAPPGTHAHGDGGEGDVLARVCAALAPATRTPERCYYAIWEGYADVANTSPGQSKLRIPNRSYYLYSGALEDAQLWADPPRDAPAIFDNPPALVWPADRGWFIACDTDPHWAGIGASTRVIADLAARDDVDVVPTTRSHQQPFYRY